MMKSTTILLLACLLMLSCGQNKEADAQPVDAAQQTEDALPESDTDTPEAENEAETESSAASAPCEAMDITDQIQAMGQEVVAAYEQGDAEALANFFTDDGQAFQPNSGIVTGKDNIRDFWQAMLDVGAERYEMSISSAKAMGKVAHAVGSSQLYLADDVLLDEAKFVLILHKVNGQWKIQTDIWNSNMPCPVK